MTARILCWFSCGVASAVATKLTIEANAQAENPLPLIVARCWVAEEDADNDRFAADCRKWFGVPILPLVDLEHLGSIYEVFRERRYISGVRGAPCTMELKKAVRERFQRPDDIHVFGYTVDEPHRWDQLLDANNNIKTWNVLGVRNLTHDDCLAIVQRAGIRLPDQYGRGFEHNNCLACVKATSPDYWRMGPLPPSRGVQAHGGRLQARHAHYEWRQAGAGQGRAHLPARIAGRRLRPEEPGHRPMRNLLRTGRPVLIEPCILAGCPEGGTVLDPFGGAGTTGLVADRHGRNAILIELNPEYAEMARKRITNDAPLFAEVASEPSGDQRE